MKKTLFGDNVVVRNATVVNGVDSFDQLPLSENFLQPSPHVFFSGGRFAETLPIGSNDPVTEIDGTGLYLIPGFVDLQVNDFFGVSRDRTDEEMRQRLRQITEETLLEEGVTSYVMATIAMPFDHLLQYLGRLNDFRHQVFDCEFANGTRPFAYHEQLMGALVEGTWMNRKFRGCHNPEYVLHIDESDLWLRQMDAVLACGSIFSINVAPEGTFVHKRMEAIRHVASHEGVLCSAGHTQPTAFQLRMAVEQGTSYVIHLGNGSTGHSWKSFHSGGMLEEALRNDNLHVTLIADGIHVSKEYIRDWIHRKDLGRVSLITDRAFVTEAPEVDFSVFGVNGRRENTPHGSFYRTFEQGYPTFEELMDPASTAVCTLFGAAVTMLKTFSNCLTWYSEPLPGINLRQHQAYNLASALAIAVTLCCLNPMRLAKRDMDFGRVAPGYVCNSLLVRVDPKTFQVEIVHVFLGTSKAPV